MEVGSGGAKPCSARQRSSGCERSACGSATGRPDPQPRTQSGTQLTGPGCARAPQGRTIGGALEHAHQELHHMSGLLPRADVRSPLVERIDELILSERPLLAPLKTEATFQQ